LKVDAVLPGPDHVDTFVSVNIYVCAYASIKCAYM